MASMREIKRRKGSIQSTQQITKAMKLVATVKLQKARVRAENSKPYFEYMYKTVFSVLSKSGNVNHPYLTEQKTDKKAVVAITSNRGLAGGYNGNIVKLVTKHVPDKENAQIYAVGKKGRDALERYGYTIAEDYSEVMNEPLYRDAVTISYSLLDAYTSGKIGSIYLAYTSFKNTVVHEPKILKILPIDAEESTEQDQAARALMTYEPEEEDVLDDIIPKYITSLIYGALVDAVASENGARMQAMDAATNNAEEMIDDLTLSYNRARQGSITQELTEIIAGAEALD